MVKRKSISKKIRFEVFKRDSFTCQYCGGKAPYVLLEIDHIKPIAKGGTNDILNLITSCKECNAGKRDRELSDTTIIDKRRKQLEKLQARKEQIEMMFQWQKGLIELDDEVITQLSDYWSELVPGYSLNENGLKGLRKLKNRFEIDEIILAMKIATEQYIVYKDDIPTKESVEIAWKKVGGICNTRRLEKEKPYLKQLYYIRGILRNRLNYVNENLAIQLLQKAIDVDASIDSLEEHAKSVKNWTQWRQEIEKFISSQEEIDEDEMTDMG